MAKKKSTKTKKRKGALRQPNAKKKAKQTSPKKNWCFTSWDMAWDGDAVFATGQIAYMVWGKEEGDDSKAARKAALPAMLLPKFHYQGYLQLKSKKRMTALKKLVGPKVNLLAAMGSPQENYDYCTKDGEWKELGTRTERGQRTDIMNFVDDIQKGKSLMDAVLDNPEVALKYPAGCKFYNEMYILKQVKGQWRDVKVTVITGPTGTGKTRMALYELEDPKQVWKISGANLSKDWYCGYMGEPILVIDEYSNNIPLDHLLSVLDGHTLRLGIKGSHTYAQWTKVYMTSNLRYPECWHPKGKDVHREALKRRVAKHIDLWPKPAEDGGFVFQEDLCPDCGEEKSGLHICVTD